MGSLREALLPSTRRSGVALVALVLVGLALRLVVWRWHRLYPLGGDETEYFNQALRWLQGNGYHDLPLMRPPLYPAFLAVVFQLFDSQVQRVRLVQAIIGTAGVYLQWLLVRLALPAAGERAALVAAAFVALSFTLAANATELLTETTFGVGLLLVLCLLVAARRFRSWPLAAGAGIALGVLALVRSVALPLLPLGVLWLVAWGAWTTRTSIWRRLLRMAWLAVPFALATLVVVLPWTARNYVVYGHPILIDTTGAENLWLDNDPAGREAVKSYLYALGEDRGRRQSESMARGISVITADPARFVGKVWGEAQKLVALEYWDDLRARRAIWVPPAEVWARVVLGDGLWLVLACAGTVGLWLMPHAALRSFLGAWAAYIILTSLVFHVELRYRLPLYPILICGVAVLVARRSSFVVRRSSFVGAATTLALFIGLLLLHRPYPGEGVMLLRKHWALWREDGAAALRVDPSSALARVRLARDVVAACPDRARGCPAAETLLRDGIAVVREHPYAHLLLGALERERGDGEAARVNLAYETASLEDLQRWMVNTYGPQPFQRLDIGDGLDLGNIMGWHTAADGARWTTAHAEAWLARPASGTLRLRMAHRRPPDAVEGDTLSVRVTIDGQATDVAVGADFEVYEVPIPASADALVRVTLDAPTFRPRAFDRTSDDNRDLGVLVDWIEVGDERRTTNDERRTTNDERPDILTADCRLPTADCRLPTAPSPPAACGLPTAASPSAACGLPTAASPTAPSQEGWS